MHIRHFESFEAFLDQVKRPGHPSNPRDSITGSYHFTHTLSYEQALKLANDGWPEGLATMKSIAGDLKRLRGDQVERFDITYTESGDDVDVDRYISGEPENMAEYKPQYVPIVGRIIKMVVAINGNSGVTARQMFLRGAAAVRIADLLESAGLRSEIWIVDSDGRGQIYSQTTVVVKRPEQPIELDLLAFMLANASVHRRFWFRLCEQYPPAEFQEYYGDTYSGSVDMQNVDPDWVYIGNLPITTDAQCEQFVQQTISKYVEQPA